MTFSQRERALMRRNKQADRIARAVLYLVHVYNGDLQAKSRAQMFAKRFRAATVCRHHGDILLSNPQKCAKCGATIGRRQRD